MRGLLRDTYLELIDRRLFIIYIAITALAALVMFVIDFSSFEAQINGVKQMGFDPLVSTISTFVELLVFMTVMASAGLIPSMLVKGRVDFYLSRPVSRSYLYLNRMLAIWVVYGALMVACSGVIILIAWLRTGMLESSITYLPIVHLLGLFIWVTITCCAGVMFGSTPMVIVSAFGIWVLQYILSFHEQARQLFQSDLANMIFTTLYHITPKTGEISTLATDLANGKMVEYTPLWSSLIVSLFIILTGLALFKKKSF